jgi:SAM-dependent methyltransferase
MTVANDQSRWVKADKIVSVLRDAWPNCLSDARCLDLGCGIGVIASRVNEVARTVVAMDFGSSLVSQVSPILSRLQGDGLQIPFRDAAFDAVVCAQVYEHTKDPVRLAAEISRVLRPGGICYFSGPNRLWPYEDHYRVWFVHWLPRRWQRRALRLMGQEDSVEVILYTYWQLRRLWKQFDVCDYTVDLIGNPDRFPGADAPRWMGRIPSTLLALMAFAVPNVNWVLRKPKGEEA